MRRSDMFLTMKLFVQRSVIALFLLATISVHAKDVLTWQTDRDRVTADIQSVELLRLLEGVAKLTGWHVFIESNLTANVSVKFQDLSSGDALHRLLGDLNYAFVPQTNGRARLFVFRTARANATVAIQPGDINPGKPMEATKIPNELIVRLKPGANIEELAKKLGAKVLGKIDGMDVYRLQFADEAAADAARLLLKDDPTVASVENNYVVDPPPQIAQLDLANLPGPPKITLNPPTSDSCHPIVGLLDTGIQATGTDFDKLLLKSFSVAGQASPDPSVPSHGTSMLVGIGTGALLANKGGPTPRVISVDVYGPDATTSTFTLAQGIPVAINNGANIINLSLGSTGDSQILHDIIAEAVKKGIPVFAAAGNSASSQPFYPAAYPEVISVAAGKNGQLAPYSNYGSYIKLMVPGSEVVYFNNSAYLVSGTSTSSAVSSGLAAGAAAANCIPTGAAANGLLNNGSLQFKPAK